MGLCSAPMLVCSNVYGGCKFSRGPHVFGGFSFLWGSPPLVIFFTNEGHFDSRRVAISLGCSCLRES